MALVIRGEVAILQVGAVKVAHWEACCRQNQEIVALGQDKHRVMAQLGGGARRCSCLAEKRPRLFTLVARTTSVMATMKSRGTSSRQRALASSRMADVRPDEAASEEVNSIHFSFYNDDEIKRISVKQITKSDRVDAKNCPVPGGLLDPAMGPTNDTDT
ncbi:hypothetical protein OsJ_17573 [Oryza sativa Japonica Group]|uniref:DNA-directed RNA polymerase n=2 Tax=Oryza sativa TaxID=4530 RepID=B9FN53_ORYSJ|nr:hypothetical protein OsJ_17573 [Oryza sativa Japonica Group]